jgi:diguanylate cyclase (GGDEF)-like protein
MNRKILNKARWVVVILGLILLAFIISIVGHIHSISQGKHCVLGLVLSQETALLCLISAVALFIPIVIYLMLQLLKIDQLEQAVDTDELTGLYNRRCIEKLYNLQTERYKRFGEYFSVMFLDINDFKTVNDRWGHDLGDEVLAKVGQKILENVRVVDLPVRYGGDEFVIIMPQTDYAGAVNVLKRLQSEVNAILLSQPTETANIGISGGVAVFPGDGEDFAKLLRIADGRMYSEKQLQKTASVPGVPSSSS